MRRLTRMCLWTAVIGGLIGCASEKQPRDTPKTAPKIPPRPATKVTRGVRCEIPAATLAKIKAASVLLEVSAAQRGAWVQMLLDKCKGWPAGIERSLKMAAPGRPEDKLRLPSPNHAQRKEVERLQNKMCPGLVKRLIAATRKDYAAPAWSVWEHCKFATWKVVSKREWANGTWENAYALLLYRLLADGGQPHGVARTLARLFAQRTRVNEKEGEMMRVRSSSRTVFVPGVQLLVSASTLLADKQSVANVKNGRVDANTKRDGPDGYFIDPLFKALKARLKGTKSIAPPLRVVVHRGNPYRLVAEVLYSAVQAGHSSFQLVVNSNVATDAAVVVGVTVGGKAAKPIQAVTIRMTPKAYELRHANGKLASTHPAQPLKAAAARAALAKAMHARSVKSKTSGETRGVVHLQVANTIPYSDVILLLDSLRVHPGMAAKGGCPLVYNTDTGSWTPAPGARSRCMCYRPRLRLVNP